jgi:DNA-binding MarR family transcriptional regulator
MAPSVNSTADQVLDVIPLVMRVIRKEFRSQRDPELTLPEFRSLAFINRTGGCSLNEVADHIGLEAPTTSKLVDNLVKRGVISRQEDPGDRRRVRLQISPMGKKSIDIAFDHTRKFLATRLAHLTDKERQGVVLATEILKEAFAGEPVIQTERVTTRA